MPRSWLLFVTKNPHCTVTTFFTSQCLHSLHRGATLLAPTQFFAYDK
uniref:Uncharacterized protein n=1 Tax=Rhizophora mucronata TaxID=61149 RepID=A0A2P2PQN2_RHIMU